MNKNHFLTLLRALFSSEEYTPLTQTALLKHLKITSREKKQKVKEALDTLLKAEEIIIKKNTFVLAPPKPQTLIGTLRTNPKGFGFVIAEDNTTYKEDTFIPKHLTNSAVDGDIVEVELLSQNNNGKGPEGKIIAVLERSRSHLGGIVTFKKEEGFVIFSPLLGKTKQILCPSLKEKLKIGDRVIAKVLDWGGKEKPIICEVTKLLGHIKDPSIDTMAAAEEFQIPNAFPRKVIEQAKSFGKIVSKKSQEGRKDFSKITTLTIDPTTAKDFDDAISISKDKKGQYHLGVHIADVAFYVKPGTPLDKEAIHRANSTYFPGSCLPMLPEELSNNLCSLKEKVIRLTVSVLMTFAPNGQLLSYTIERSFIKSAKRFTYENAKAILDGKKQSKYKKELILMVELCHLLKKLRADRGTIDFALPEVVLDIDAEGNPYSFHVVEYDITHQMVEEFMLKANEIVAKSLKEKNLPVIFRIHEEPATDNLEEFFSLARSFGFFLPGQPSPKDVQKLFLEAANTPYAQRLSIAFIRSMKLASYSPDNIGHYGLALEEYCHFTSPIRRYPDLIIQRLLFGEHDLTKELEAIAEECSNKERVSFKAEQSVKTLKKMRLLHNWHQKNKENYYACQITKVKPFGIHFELSSIGLEGFLHVSEMGDDYFIYESETSSLLGRSTRNRLSIGDTIEMKVKEIDLILLEVKWELASNATPLKEKKKQKGKKRRK